MRFDCYPSQYTYDTIAKLKNGDLTYNNLDPEIKKYIVNNGNGSYSLRTNTTATLDWDDTRTDADEQAVEYVNPDPVRTDAATMSVTKTWENELDARRVGSIDMTVLMSNEDFHHVTLSDPTWKVENIYISPGIIKDGQVLSGAEGHDFTFAELGPEQYNWELVAPTVHPMIIDGTLTMLTLVDAAHPAPSGAQTYRINGKTYYSNGSSSVSLDAYNYRRSNLNLTKVVTGEDAPADAAFPFTLKVKNSKAPAAEPTDDPQHNSDYWVWFSIYDTKAGATVTNATVSGATGPNADGYYYAPSNSAISVQMKDGWNLRFTNLPAGTTYEFEEGTMPTGFAFNKAELTSGTDSTFSGAKKSTGTVAATNTTYGVTYTNDYQLTNLEITKVWDDADDQDGKRLTADELKAKLTLSPAVQGKEPTIVDNGNGTYTITYTGLPRFNNGQEVEYTVTESAIEGYETAYSNKGDHASVTVAANDHGTITNTHEAEVFDIPVEKKWEDANNQDGIRPASVTINLKDGNTTVGTVTLNADNSWKDSFKELPKYREGKLINYEVEEVKTSVITGTDGPGTYGISPTGDAEKGYTVTNTHTPEKTTHTVTKAWEDANDQDGYRPTQITVYLKADGTKVEGSEVTLKAGADGSWAHTWTGLPKYKNGKLIKYSADENAVEHYEGDAKTDDNKLSTAITNTHETEQVSYTVTKAWVDDNNRDNLRPESIKVQLNADGEKYGDEVVLNEANGWTYTWEGLDKNKKITVATDEGKGYQAEISGQAESAESADAEGENAAEKTEAEATDVESVEKTEEAADGESVEKTQRDCTRRKKTAWNRK